MQGPPDGGTLYAETNLHDMFPEPLNAITSFFFLIIAFYFTTKIWGKFKEHLFLSFALVLLYVGGIGGTAYHAFRLWHIFIIMDWLPIMLLCISAGIYFLSKLVRWYFSGLMVLIYIFFQFFIRQQFNQENFQIFININYAFMAGLVLIPVMAYLIKTVWKNGKWVGFALFAFIFALTFRITDKWEIFSFGTHFLWHIFGAVASFCMLQFIYLINEKK